MSPSSTGSAVGPDPAELDRLRERARQLIAIADPAHRDDLRRQADELGLT